MNAFMLARRELYTLLYQRFTHKDGPYCGKTEIEAYHSEFPLMKAAVLFADDLGHLKQNKIGGHRLTAQGILYAEEQGWTGGEE